MECFLGTHKCIPQRVTAAVTKAPMARVQEYKI